MLTRARSLPSSPSLRSLPAAILLVAALSATAAAQVDPRLYSGLVWRNIGPFRGGRISAVTGVIGQPGVFYAGLPLGGVWKTTSAGTTWFPIMDDVKEVSSVGALEVAPSDPNIIYAGMGDLITGLGINEGNGIYKSTDAGKTWQHLGLDDTKQIPSLLVDPRDPNLVLVAAQGNIHTHTEMRGVFRSTDGGRTWTKTLFVDNETGAQKIAWAYDHPEVMLATTVKHYQAPGSIPARGFVETGPTSTHLFKSTDEGKTWTEITGGGLPRLAGRTSVAVAMNTNASRMYLIGQFGLYRSDDGGANWRQMAANDRRIAGSGYICDVYVDPRNPDVVYTMGTTSYRSTDGGQTFHAFKGAPGGDDPHVLWIDPTDPQRLFLGVDQGATISLDGGKTWSSWYNQPTEQVYHISTDNQYPYWVYASQQDAGSIETASRGNFGAITPFDWRADPGYEFGTVVADPLNPRIVYAGGPGGGIVRETYPSGQWINISPNVDASAALRKVTNQPLLFAPKNPRELLAGFQFVMSTTDGGMHWKKLGGDLTVRRGEAQLAGAPAGRNGPPGGAIEAMSASSVDPAVIWVGTNNGIIQVTRNHGATWTDVSIADMPNAALAEIEGVDASHFDAGSAYVAVDYHTSGDYAPYIYRTHDYGKTWTKIVNGLATDQPSGSFARTVREDLLRKGLLFAGTESSMYVSFDDGDHWQSLQLNLPNTSYRDIAVHGNDVVVGTYGRSIYVLDDISPLRQLSAAMAETVHLYRPGDAIRVRRNVNGDTPFPPEVPHADNPPPGAIIYYYLNAAAQGDVTLEIADAGGHVVRHMSSAPIPALPDPPPAVPDYWLEKPQPMPTGAGANRINWDLRHDAPPAFTHNFGSVMGANAGLTPPSPEGPLVMPGTYTLKLTVNGQSHTQPLVVKNDPRSPAAAADLMAQHDLQMKLYWAIHETWDAYNQVFSTRSVVSAAGANAAADVRAASEELAKKLTTVSGTPVFGRRGGGFPGAGPAAPPNFVDLNAALIRQLETLDFGDMAPNEAMLHAWTVACGELKTALSQWKTLQTRDLAAFNALLAKNGRGQVRVPGGALAPPAC